LTLQQGGLIINAPQGSARVGFPNGGPVVSKRIITTFSVWLTLLSGLVLAAAVSPWSLAAPSAAAPKGAPQARTPLAQGPAADLNLAFTAQAIGWIEPCG